MKCVGNARKNSRDFWRRFSDSARRFAFCSSVSFFRFSVSLLSRSASFSSSLEGSGCPLRRIRRSYGSPYNIISRE